MAKAKKSKAPEDLLLGRQYLDPSEGPRTDIKVYLTEKDKRIITKAAHDAGMKRSFFVGRIVKRYIEEQKLNNSHRD